MFHRPLSRRQALAALAALPWLSSMARAEVAGARVIVVGGGFAGATAARHLKQAAPELEVLLLEPKSNVHTCPFSNYVIAGLRD
uniref:FAD-dependent oxidoreductase n=1 Tax=Pseudomonas sp. TaxID=306 RepID=UPI0028A8C4E1